MEQYEKRKIVFTGIQKVGDWQIKTYSIQYTEESFSQSLEHAALALFETEFPKLDENIHGLGFMIVHHGKGSNFVVLDYWCNENELVHNVFYSSKRNPKNLIKQNTRSPIACVWDLVVINHERNAWVKNMMSKVPNRVNYLDDSIHGYF